MCLNIRKQNLCQACIFFFWLLIGAKIASQKRFEVYVDFRYEL